MPKGYYIAVNNFVAEIVEVDILEIISTPDGERIFHVVTEYGEEDYIQESRIKPIKKMLEKEFEELKKELEKSKGKRNIAGSHRQKH